MQNQLDNSFDILICGAGLIGTSLALALAPLSLRVAVTEALPLKTEINLQSDGRTLALSYASVKILQAIDVWPRLVDYATPIKTVHVSERERFGKLRFKAEEEGVAALGYVIPAPLLGATLNQALLAQSARLTLFTPAKVVALIRSGQSLGSQARSPVAAGPYKLHDAIYRGPPSAPPLSNCDHNYEVVLQTAEGEKRVSAKLVIAADGVNSSLRELMGIKVQTKDYHQSALVTRVVTALPHNNVAYERFIEDGAIALLPLTENKAALIVTGKNDFIQKLQALDESAFLHEVQTYFGQRLGIFLQAEKRHVHPLKGIYAGEQVKENFVLLGNAAHTMHPIAAQGFNLGLQDVALLAEMLSEAVKNNKNFAELNFLQFYASQRKQSQQRIVNFAHNLISIFTHDFLPLALARSASLKLLDIIPPAKHRLAKQLMGISGKLSKLALGVPLDKT